MADPQDIINGLRYIASSPPREHGGFHQNAVQTAKDAIELIEKLLAVAEAARDYAQATSEGDCFDAADRLDKALNAIAAYDTVEGGGE